MGVTFPSAILQSGAITQRPYSSGQVFLTTRSMLACGVVYTFYNRNVALNRFTLNFNSMTAAELAILENFFTLAQGRANTWDFTDPDHVYHPYCRFDADDFIVSYISVNHYQCSIPVQETIN